MLDLKGRVAVITGAGGGLGKAYSLYLASHGASIVVNDVGSTLTGGKASSSPADRTVSEIRAAGGTAVSDHHSVTTDAKAIIEAAISNFGRIDIVINNAGIIRDRSFSKMTEDDWDAVIDVHLHGSYAVTKHAWPYMMKQNYGRIIMTASAAGLYGNFGQANYSAAKMALIGFSKSLAYEGSKHNITCNVIAPLAASRISETAFPPDLLEILKPEAIAPIVGYLSHEHSADESGSIFETAGGYTAKIRYQRSAGVLVNVEENNPSPVSDLISKFKAVEDFSTSSTYPTKITDTPWIDLVAKSSKLPIGKKNDEKILSNQVVIITGAGGGLGKAYALLLASLGGSIIVNDMNQKAALDVVSQIQACGGKAEANFNNVVNEGKLIVQHALKSFGRIDVIINNAGILRDKSFSKQTPEMWKLVIDVHLRGTFSLCHAAWPIFIGQKYGRIINTASAVGLYGNFGQSNYAAAKAGIIGLSKALAIEGAKYNIKVNIIAPNAGTAMTATIMPADIVQTLKPSYVAPIVAILASKEYCTVSGMTFEAGSGWFSMVRLQRSGGYAIPLNSSISDVAKAWPKITAFNPMNSTFPSSIKTSIEPMLKVIQSSNAKRPQSTANQSDLSLVSVSKFTYSEKDLILYALGIGCNETQLHWIYERDSNFSALPTFGVIPGLSALFKQDGSGPSEWANYIPKFNLMSLLHGEQTLQIHNPIPKAAALSSVVSIVSISQKGQNNAIVVLRVDSKDSVSGTPLFSNEITLLIRNLKLSASQLVSNLSMQISSAATFESSPIKKMIKKSFQTKPDQAVLYRLSGDLNPLHVDPSMAAMAGFKRPILHGLCTFGIAGRLILEAMEDMELKMIKGRFSRPVLPGDTLVINMEVRSSETQETHLTFTVYTSADTSPILNNGYAILAPKTASSAEKPKMDNNSNVISKMAASWKLLPEKVKKDLLSKFNAVIKFELDSSQSAWFLLKEGISNTGLFVDIKAKDLPKPDLILKLNEDTLSQLVDGSISPQQAFLKGKVKFSGKMGLAMNLELLLKKLKANTQSKL